MVDLKFRMSFLQERMSYAKLTLEMMQDLARSMVKMTSRQSQEPTPSKSAKLNHLIVASKLELLWYRTEPPLPPSIEELWSALTDVLDRLNERISDDMRDVVEVTMRRNKHETPERIVEAILTAIGLRP